MLSQQIFPLTPKKAQILSHDTRWKIMELLSNDKNLYAKTIAKILGLSEQKIHYHLNILRKEGFLIPTKIVHVKRGRAKLFRPLSSHFLLSLTKTNLNLNETAFKIIFDNYFVEEGQFNGKIIVGSAEPHGKYDAISRDGYLVGDLCMYIGNHLPLQKSINFRNVVSTDLDYKLNNKNNAENLILIGGHITNTMTSHFNDVLKSKFGICFVENRIVGPDKEYTHPTHGMIARFRNKNSKKSWILVLAGVRSLGTRAAIHSIISDRLDVLGEGSEFISVLKGETLDEKLISGVTKVLTKSIMM